MFLAFSNDVEFHRSISGMGRSQRASSLFNIRVSSLVWSRLHLSCDAQPSGLAWSKVTYEAEEWREMELICVSSLKIAIPTAPPFYSLRHCTSTWPASPHTLTHLSLPNADMQSFFHHVFSAWKTSASLAVLLWFHLHSCFSSYWALSVPCITDMRSLCTGKPVF